MIYDYGMSKKIKKQNIKNLISDYAGIIPAFLNVLAIYYPPNTIPYAKASPSIATVPD